jgi:hypothetical protein
MRKHVRAVVVGSPFDAGAKAVRLRADLFAGIVAAALLALALAVVPRPAALPDLTSSQTSAETAAKLPLAFVPNEGQTDRRARYYAQGSGFGFFFTHDRVALSFQAEGRGHALDLRFVGANPEATLAPERRAEGRVNYLRGDDPRGWQTGLPTYHQSSPTSSCGPASTWAFAAPAES